MTYLKLNGRVTIFGRDVPMFHGRHGVIRAITGAGVSVLLDHEGGPMLFARGELALSDAELTLGPFHRARFRDPLPRDERRRLSGHVPPTGMEVVVEERQDSGAWLCRFHSIRQALDTALHTNPVPGGQQWVRAVTPDWLDPLPLWAGGPVPANPHAPAWWYAREAAPPPAPPGERGAVAGVVAVVVTYADGEERRSALAATELPAVEAALANVPGATYRVEAA